ncbi:MAG: hypothetical protein HOV92_12650 [Streptomyces sp.]|jgi:hypothetical protein|nr:hypothetical protein [Streptomyces sp.]
MDRIAQTPAIDFPPAALGGLLVGFDSVLGEDRQPLNEVTPGATVTATVQIGHLRLTDNGDARGSLYGEGGWAIFTVRAAHLPGLYDTLFTWHPQIKIRGTVTRPNDVNTIEIFAARAVNV